MFELLWVELNLAEISNTDLNSVAEKFLTIIVKAQKGCCDPMNNFALNYMDNNFEDVFVGISTNIQTWLTNNNGATNSLRFFTPYSSIN